MKLLLDTHIWVWSLGERDRIRGRARDALESAENERWLSPISVWEAIHLLEKGRISFVRDASSMIREAIRLSRVQEAALTHEIAMESRRLPRFHGDPADRFLVATARVMKLTLITADRKILESGVCAAIPNA